jgi:hypothetical protein
LEPILDISLGLENNSFLHYAVGNKILLHKKIEFGLMSGIKMTSLFGSLINAAICNAVLSELEIKPSYMAVLGDDIDLSFNEIVDAKSIFDKYKEYNFPISATKSFFSAGQS